MNNQLEHDLSHPSTTTAELNNLNESLNSMTVDDMDVQVDGPAAERKKSHFRLDAMEVRELTYDWVKHHRAKGTT